MNWNGGARSRFQQPGGVYRGQFQRTYQLDTRPRQGDRNNDEFGFTEHVESKRHCPILDFIRTEVPNGEILALQLSHQMELDVELVPTNDDLEVVSSSGLSSPRSPSDRHVSWSQGRMSSVPDDDDESGGRDRDLLSNVLLGEIQGRSNFFNMEDQSSTVARASSDDVESRDRVRDLLSNALDGISSRESQARSNFFNMEDHSSTIARASSDDVESRDRVRDLLSSALDGISTRESQGRSSFFTMQDRSSTIGRSISDDGESQNGDRGLSLALGGISRGSQERSNFFSSEGHTNTIARAGSDDVEIESRGRDSVRDESQRRSSFFNMEGHSSKIGQASSDGDRSGNRERDLLRSAVGGNKGRSNFFNLDGHTSGRASSLPDYRLHEPMEMSIEDEGLLADEIIRSVLDSSPEMWNTPPESPSNSITHEKISEVQSMHQLELESKSKSI